MDVTGKDLAPIVLFVYNRPWHTQQTLEALKKNELADQSTLYVFCDGPKNDASSDTKLSIAKTRACIKSKQWCKNVIIEEKETNNGLANSIIEGVTRIVNQYGKIIVLEDDILTSKYFLKFINEALNKYQNTTLIKSITGYFEPIEIKEEEPFFLTKGSSWGWGTWSRVWNEMEWSTNNLIEEFNTDEKINSLNFSGYPYYEMLKLQAEDKINSWAIRFYASCVLKGGLHLTPPKSLVQNIGFDGSGQHCQSDNFLDKSIIYNIDYNISSLEVKINLHVPKMIQIQREKSEKKQPKISNKFHGYLYKIKRLLKQLTN